MVAAIMYIIKVLNLGILFYVDKQYRADGTGVSAILARVSKKTYSLTYADQAHATARKPTREREP